MNLLCRRRAIIAYGTATFTGEYLREAATKKKPSPSSLCNKPNDTVFITTLCGMRLWAKGRVVHQTVYVIHPLQNCCPLPDVILFLLSQTLLLHQQSTQKANCLKWQQTKEYISWLASMKHFWQNSWFNWSTTLRKNQTKLVKKGRWLFLQPSSTKVISFLCQNFSFAIPKRRHTSIIGER